MLKYAIKDARNTEEYFKRNKESRPNLILTSPPYYDIKNYENSKKQLGYNQTYKEYISEVSNILQQCYNISDDNSTLWLIVDTVRKNGKLVTLPFDIIYSLRSINSWELKDLIIWEKNKSIPWHHKGRFKNSFEYILFFTKGKNYKFNIDRIRELKDYKEWYKSYPERYNVDGQPPTNIWQFSVPIRGWGNGYQQHLCPFPFQLIERIINLSTDEGDLVFDPFAGSGSVLAVADFMDRDAIGFDLSMAYKKTFVKEVIKGTEIYFKQRKREIIKNKTALEKFKKLNLKLRKVKAAIEISEMINSKFAHPSNRFIVLDDEEQSIKLYFISDKKYNENKVIKTINMLKKQVSSEYKLTLLVYNLSSEKFNKIFDSNKKLYIYNKERIYKHSGKYKISEILNGKGDSNKIYSNLFVSIK